MQPNGAIQAINWVSYLYCGLWLSGLRELSPKVNALPSTVMLPRYIVSQCLGSVQSVFVCLAVSVSQCLQAANVCSFSCSHLPLCSIYINRNCHLLSCNGWTHFSFACCLVCTSWCCPAVDLSCVVKYEYSCLSIIGVLDWTVYFSLGCCHSFQTSSGLNPGLSLKWNELATGMPDCVKCAQKWTLFISKSILFTFLFWYLGHTMTS